MDQIVRQAYEIENLQNALLGAMGNLTHALEARVTDMETIKQLQGKVTRLEKELDDAKSQCSYLERQLQKSQMQTMVATEQAKQAINQSYNLVAETTVVMKLYKEKQSQLDRSIETQAKLQNQIEKLKEENSRLLSAIGGVFGGGASGYVLATAAGASNPVIGGATLAGGVVGGVVAYGRDSDEPPSCVIL